MIELLLIVLVLLVLFGPGRLPRAGQTLGRTVRGFKDALRGEAKPGVGRGGPGAGGRPPGEEAKDG
jgi:TatA/E family protein of Tat protein translocase